MHQPPIRFKTLYLIAVVGFVVFSGCRKDTYTQSEPNPIDADGLSVSDIAESEESEADPLACLVNSDCEGTFPDAGPCDVILCSSSDQRCIRTTKSDFASCESTDLCAETAQCQEGECIPLTMKNCDDGSVCTSDSCDSATGCIYEESEGSCDDGNSCTMKDTCMDGYCVGQANICTCESDSDCTEGNDENLCNGSLRCDENNQCVLDPATVVVCTSDPSGCTTGICEPETGECALIPKEDGAGCDDGNLCTLGDQCAEGVCVATGTESCGDPSNPCIESTCDPEFGCDVTAVEGACDDGNLCTVQDVCVEGICVGEIEACECQTDLDCVPFEDGNLCNGTLACVSGLCAVEPNTIPSCVVASSSPCIEGSCDPATGLCETSPVNEGATCSDGNPCTANDVCADGGCISGAAVDCDDGNPCTLDSCDPEGEGCIALFHSVPCDDGDACTVGDTCNEGVCSGLTAPGCEPACTTDGDCEDGDPCTIGKCNPLGVCTFSASGLCDCQSDEECDDGNLCTDSLCTDGTCTVTDSNGPCEDGDPCTLGDSCFQGACKAGTPLNCEDGNPCTATNCVDGGCQTVFLMNPCEDGNLCTSGDQCVLGTCVPGTPVSCDDQNDCTVDSCDPTQGCSATSLDGAACSPQNGCELQGTCNQAVCEVIGDEGTCCSADVHCLSNLPCLEGICNEGKGACTYLPLTCASPDESCALSYCEDGFCTTSPPLAANEMVSIVTSDFNSGTATGWLLESTHPDVFWSPVLGTGVGGSFGLYMGNPLTLSYDGGDLTATALSPPVSVPSQGGQVEYRLRKTVQDAACPLDALQVTVIDALAETEVPIQTLCGSTVGFDTFQFSLDEFGGKIVRLKFVFSTGTAENNDAYGVVLDNLKFEIRAPESCCESGTVCDDGNPCTNDSCGGGGLCQNSPCGGSIPCIESGCSNLPCTGDDCCNSDADCDDLFACTEDICVSGTCVHPPVSCGNTTDCAVDFCFQGVCIASGPSAAESGQTIFFESFDDGMPNGWTFTSSVEEASWSLTPSRVQSPPLALYGGIAGESNYNFGNGFVTAKLPLQVLPQDQLTLRVSLWADLDDEECDLDILQGYVTFPGTSTVATTLAPTWCTSTNGWEVWEMDLTNFGGSSVQIALSFSTNSAQANLGEGVYIDDVQILAFPEEPCN